MRPDRIDPGKPQQNGRHERLHRTLKGETADPPATTLGEQQRRFDAFRTIYNGERPHAALGLETPASVYRPSQRAYPCALREPTCGEGAAVRRVRSNGEIKRAGGLVFISEALIGEPVAIKDADDGEWLVRYAHLELGRVDKAGRLRRHKPPPRPRPACGLVDNTARCAQGPQAQQQQQQTAT